MEIGSVRLTGPAIAGVPRVRQRISTARGSFAPFPGSDGGPPPGGPVPARLGAGSPPRQKQPVDRPVGFLGTPRSALVDTAGDGVESPAHTLPPTSPQQPEPSAPPVDSALSGRAARPDPRSPEPRAASLGSPEAARLLRRRAGCRGIFRTRVVRPGRARLPPGRPVLRAPAAPAGLATLADLVVQRGQFLVQGR